MFYPNFLKPGSTIGVPAPSDGAYDNSSILRFKNAIKQFEEMNYKIIPSKNLYNSKMARSATAEERAKELNKMFESEDIDMIICAAGGEFLLEILPYMDFSKLLENPKFIQGFSDSTGIMYVVTTKYDIATIYASNFKSYGMKELELDFKNNLKIITGNIIEQNSFELYEEEGFERVTGLECYNLTKKVEWKIIDREETKFRGRIIGGCFDNIVEIAGTKYDGGRQFVEKYKNDGIIWYFDNCELSYESVIRNLWRFNELGYFEYTKGIIFGRFGIERTNLGYTIEEALKDSVIYKLNIPIIYEDISHKGPSMTIINGAIAEVQSKKGKGNIKLELL